MNVGKLSQFWLYILNKEEFTSYKTENIDTIILNDADSIKKEDIIIIYYKNKGLSGFYILLQIGDNKKVKKTNENHIIIKNKVILEKPIQIKKMIQYLKSNETGFVNEKAFRNTFLKHENNIVELNEIGRKIVTRIIQETQQDQEETQEQDLEEQEEAHEGQDQEEQEDQEEEVQEDIESGSDVESDDEVEEENTNGFIPVMMIPCKNFKLPDEGRVDYFVDHLKSCYDCDLTNNNQNKSFIFILDTSTVEFLEITETKHVHFNPPLNAYHSLKNYETSGVKSLPFIRISYINNGHEMYNGCMLITWIE
jgi:hypothetical protein